MDLTGGLILALIQADLQRCVFGGHFIFLKFFYCLIFTLSYAFVYVGITFGSLFPEKN